MLFLNIKIFNILDSYGSREISVNHFLSLFAFLSFQYFLFFHYVLLSIFFCTDSFCKFYLLYCMTIELFIPFFRKVTLFKISSFMMFFSAWSFSTIETTRILRFRVYINMIKYLIRNLSGFIRTEYP